jgi:hypothetical protein
MTYCVALVEDGDGVMTQQGWQRGRARHGSLSRAACTQMPLQEHCLVAHAYQGSLMLSIAQRLQLKFCTALVFHHQALCAGTAGSSWQ